MPPPTSSGSTASIKDFLAIITPGDPGAYVLWPENKSASISIFSSSNPLI